MNTKKAASFLWYVIIVAMVMFSWSAIHMARAEWTPVAMNQQIDQTNFVVNRGCSGTLIDLKNRYVLTAEHCIDEQYEIVTRERIKDDGVVVEEKIRRTVPGTVTQLTFSDDALQVKSVTYRTKLVLADKKTDLALVQILSEIPNVDAALIACRSPVRGDTVYAVGNPKGFLYSSMTKGIVSSVQRNYPMINETEYEENALIQMSAPIVGGNSGGSLYNDEGELIGVPVRGYSVNETIGFAVPLDDIKKFLTRNGSDRLWTDRCGK